MFERIKIVVGYDNSLQSRKALDEAITIAKAFSGFIKVVNVHAKGKLENSEATLVAAELSLKRAEIRHECISVLGSNAGKVLVNEAKQGSFDLIVVGNRGLGGGVSMLLGSVSKQVVSNSNGNVLVVKK
jgi:nucleotide-binding universal stress UspA family protein